MSRKNTIVIKKYLHFDYVKDVLFYNEMDKFSYQNGLDFILIWKYFDLGFIYKYMPRVVSEQLVDSDH
jgi:hypothetical protein